MFFDWQCTLVLGVQSGTQVILHVWKFGRDKLNFPMTLGSCSKDCTISINLLACSWLPFNIRRHDITLWFLSFTKVFLLVTWMLLGDLYLCALSTWNSWKKTWIYPESLLIFIILRNHLCFTASAYCYFFSPREIPTT